MGARSCREDAQVHAAVPNGPERGRTGHDCGVIQTYPTYSTIRPPSTEEPRQPNPLSWLHLRDLRPQESRMQALTRSQRSQRSQRRKEGRFTVDSVDSV